MNRLGKFDAAKGNINGANWYNKLCFVKKILKINIKRKERFGFGDKGYRQKIHLFFWIDFKINFYILKP